MKKMKRNKVRKSERDPYLTAFGFEVEGIISGETFLFFHFFHFLDSSVCFPSGHRHPSKYANHKMQEFKLFHSTTIYLFNRFDYWRKHFHSFCRVHFNLNLLFATTMIDTIFNVQKAQSCENIEKLANVQF